MPDKSDAILEWLTALAGLLGKANWTPEKLIAVDLASMHYARELAMDFELFMFTADSRRFIAGRLNGWPNYATLTKALYAFRKEHPAAALPALPSDTPTDWSAHERAMYAIWCKQEAEEWGTTRKRIQLKLLRNYAPRVLAHIKQRDTDADYLERDQTPVTAEDKAGQINEHAVRRSVQSLIGHPMRGVMLRWYATLLARQKPSLLPLFERELDSPAELAVAYRGILADAEAHEVHAIARHQLGGNEPCREQRHEPDCADGAATGAAGSSGLAGGQGGSHTQPRWRSARLHH